MKENLSQDFTKKTMLVFIGLMALDISVKLFNIYSINKFKKQQNHERK